MSTARTASFIRSMNNPLKFRLFLFAKLPAAYLAGVRLREIDEAHCKVTVPYKWLSQNPFRSTYFACLSMAAELSTGALAMAHMQGSVPAISMLVVKVESAYFKKATERTTFLCRDGELFRQAAEETVRTGQPVEVRAHSRGTNKQGDLIAEFFVTWSFKARSQDKNNK
jgi:hypothetical protein